MTSLKLHLPCLLLAALFLSGCAATKYAEPNITPDAAYDAISQTRNAVYEPKSVRLVAKVDYYDGTENKRVVGRDFVISAQAPANLRVTISSFDKALSTLVTNGPLLSLLDAMNNVFITGSSTPQNISRILPIYLSAHDIYRVLVSQYPDENIDHTLSNTLVWDESVGGYRQDFQLKDGRVQHVYYAYPTGDMIKITITNGDTLEYDFQASDFKAFSSHAGADLDEDIPAQSGPHSVRLPQTIVFHLVPQKTDVRLRVDSYDIDVDFVPQVFTLTPPEGTKLMFFRNDALPEVRPADHAPATDAVDEPPASSDPD